MGLRAAAFSFALATAAMPAGLGPVSAAPAHFDGSWSVLVITDSGTCDRGYRYAVEVENGKIRYSGDASIVISGKVEGNGKLNVSISRGAQRASGSGKLSADRGTGEWRGADATADCSGHWQAERRAAN